MKCRILFLACCLAAAGRAQTLPILDGQMNPSRPGSPVRDVARLNVGGNNPSSNNAQDGACLASRGSVFAAVWAEQGGTTSNFQDIGFSLSADGGLNWSTPIRADVGDAPHASDADFPQVVFVDKPNPQPGQVPYNIVVVFETNIAYGGALIDDVALVVSTDGGLSFQAANPSRVNTGAGSANSDADEIWLASEGSTVYVVWSEDGQTAPSCVGGGHSIFFTRSLDGGLSYEPAQVVNSVVLTNPANPCSNSDANTPMVVAYGGEVWVTYTDNRGGNDRVFVAYSPAAGAAGTWNEVSIESSPTADVNHPRIAVRRVNAGPGTSQVVVVWEDADPGQYCLKMSISYDSGANWIPEINASPLVLNTPNAGVSADYLGYHKHVVVDDGRTFVIWLDDHNAASLGVATNRGDTPGSRQLNFGSFDSAGVALVAQTVVDPGVANQFPDMVARGNTIIVHVERNPFGGNDLIYATSVDAGLSWKRFLVPNSVAGDVDSPGYTVRQPNAMAADWTNGSATSVFWNNPLGRNEVYISGIRLPYLARIDAGGISTMVIDQVPGIQAGSPFQIALGASGIYPVTRIGASYVPLVIDALTLDALTNPFLLPFITGTVGGVGAGIASAGFPTPPSPFNVSAAGVVITPAGFVFTDGFAL